MGVDIVSITAHSLTAHEVFVLPQQMKTWDEFYAIDKERMEDSEEIVWDEWVNPEEIEKAWINNENVRHEELGSYIGVSLNTPFGWIDFNRHTLRIRIFPEHKYANVWYRKKRSTVFKFCRALALRFGADKIIYTADTYTPYAAIECWASDGCTLAEIIERANAIGGPPSNDLYTGLRRCYYIDYTTLPEDFSFRENEEDKNEE